MNTQKLNFQNFKNFGIVQFQTDFRNTFEYISLSEGIENEFIEIREVSESGSVNNLLVINKSRHFVFMSDGDILKGAKQNRLLNTSVFIEPQSKTVIPVSCVEAGRWRKTSESFYNEDFVAPLFMRSAKASDVKSTLKKSGKHFTDQEKIWASVSDYACSVKVFSETSNLSDLYDAKSDEFEDIINKFKAEEEANGTAIFVNNKLLSIDAYNSVKVYKEYFPRLLKGAFMEIYNMKNPKKSMSQAEAFYKTNEFIDSVETLPFDTHKGVAAGEERRFENSEMTGFELSYKNATIHFTALNLGRKQ